MNAAAFFLIVESYNSSLCRTDKDADDLSLTHSSKNAEHFCTQWAKKMPKNRTVRTGIAVTKKQIT